MIKRLLPLVLVVCTAFGASAQMRPGSLIGVVKDKQSGETVPMAEIQILEGTAEVQKGATDLDGKFNINPVDPGTYNVVVKVFGYHESTITGVQISPGRPTTLNFEISPSSVQLDDVVVTGAYVKPLVERGKTSNIVDRSQIENLGSRDIGTIVSTTAGVYSADEGQSTYFRGSRSNTNLTLIDGVKVRGSVSLPREAIESVEVITGGLPAQYGDATGGVTSLTTRGPSSSYFGTVELLSSHFLDAQDYNLAGLTLSGPIWKRNDQPLVSFLLAGEFLYQYEPRPYGVTPLRVNDAKLAQMQSVPTRPSNVGFGILNEGNFLRTSDLEEIPARLNADQSRYTVNGSFNIKTSQLTNVVLGGRLVYARGSQPGFASSLMNWENNPEFISTDWSTFARFTQRFKSSDPEEGGSLIENAFYVIQLDYTRNNDKTWDPRHGDNVFRYGHVGWFETHDQRFYEYDPETEAWTHILYQDTAVTFRPSPYNPVRANYTTSYYDFVREGRIINNTFNLNNIRQGGGLLNGDNPSTIYGLFQPVGMQQAAYSKSQNSQFRLTASTTFDIKGHSLIAGLEFEQRFDRGYSLAANNLWTQMRLLQNQAITQLDLDNPIYVYDESGVFQDTINYNRAYDPSIPRTFDRNVRRELGLDPNGIDRIDIDAYDPDMYSLDMFSADELLNPSGNALVGYFGYDYTGNLQSGNPTLDDFFTQRDENGNFTRPVPAFQPIYIAGYIQDQFTFRDLFFNVGVRVDRFDANQPVLKDPYSLYPVRTVGELGGTPLANIEVPASIGDDYVVYVNDANNPSSITGYRSGDDWFNPDGSPQVDPKVIADNSGGQIQPYLLGGDELSTDGFTDYTPQVTVSPRVSFQFPINDLAAFFAHYDLLVQRPDAGLSRMNPYDYLRLSLGANSGFIANPNLLPQKTTDYEIGFQQVLTKNSALKISAFYREMRDMMQTIQVTQAYPHVYLTYGNRDFATVKGFTLGYEMRRTNNLMVNANYTMQFADGSGSSANSGANLARTGQPNLRYILPLDYDSRHQIVVNLDYRYSSGANYNGPVWWNKQVFANTGFNLLMRSSSGTPYTSRVRAYELTQPASGVPLTGQINGSRLPWIFTMELNVNKVFQLTRPQGPKRGQTLEVYASVLNLLNTRNVLNVYAYTGSPEDDGWLSSPQGSQAAAFRADAQSYADLYAVSMNSPFNYTLPRRIRLGVRYNF